MWIKIANFLSVFASLITITVFLVSVFPGIVPSPAPSVSSGSELRQPSPTDDEAPQSIWGRLRLLGQAATGLAKIALNVGVFVAKLTAVVFTPWIPARLVYISSFKKRARYYGFRPWSTWDERMPRIISGTVYLVIGAITLAVIFPSFIVSQWVWGLMMFWAEYN